MPKKRKIVRTKTLYSRRRFPKKAAGRILFILLIAILVGIGYLVMREWAARFGKNAGINKSSVPPSSVTTSSAPVSSVPISSEPEKAEVIYKTAAISADELIKSGVNIKDKLESLKAEGYTAISIELKAQNGMLSYKSANKMAEEYQSVSENAVDLKAVLKAVTDAGLIPIAQISTLKDRTAPHVSRDNSYAYSTSIGTNWFDNSVANGGKPWLNPYMDNARKYICDISKEIADSGFNTILLTNVMFPDKNTEQMNTIKTQPSRAAILNQLVKEVEDTVGENVTVIREVNANAYTAGETVFDAEIFKIPSENIALQLDFNIIEENKEQICVRNGIVTQTGVPPKITAAEIANSLIEIAQNNIDGKIIPVIKKGDFEQMNKAANYKVTDNYIITE